MTWRADNGTDHRPEGNGRCLVPPSPELLDRLEEDLGQLRSTLGERWGRARTLLAPEPRRPGFNDGLIIPGSEFPLGTSVAPVARAAADRAPLRGTVRVIVVLVDFEDQEMVRSTDELRNLFFSEGQHPHGSVREYFTEVSNGLVTLDGEVVGPYRMPLTMAQYANNASGTGGTAPNARTMARDAAVAANAAVNFAPYDNDGDGFVDAYVVLHAGPGAEQTGDAGHIWSHKWVLAGGAYTADAVKVYAYLTVPEDARTGVCAHELGHLLFGWPDLYDTDGSSAGIGNWCLMAGGTWNGAGNTPAHPSAWCKADQGWVTVSNRTTNGTVNIADVKDSNTVYRLWKDGGPGQEYFLVENRQRDRFDAELPGEGLLVWHVDDAISTNSNESHYKVALMQADGQQHLEANTNRGDGGDPFPGSSDNRAFTNSSNPDSKSHGGLNTCVAVTAISDPNAVMTAHLAVKCAKLKDTKELPDKLRIKERKDALKDRKEKDLKDLKEKERKDKDKDLKEKELVGDKRPEKPDIDKSQRLDKPPATEKGFDKPTDGGGGFAEGQQSGLEERVAALEATLHALLGGAEEPFIGEELRPDLAASPLSEEDDLAELRTRMDDGDPQAKRAYDTKPGE